MTVDEALALIDGADDETRARLISWDHSALVLADEVRRLRIAVKRAWIIGVFTGMGAHEWNVPHAIPTGYDTAVAKWEADVRKLLDTPFDELRREDLDSDTGEPQGGFTV